ncbi:MAG: hypothetical protein U0793_33470 [Gemmataceae bacterium]
MICYVTCPACQFTLTIDEGQMGKKHVCPRCGASFLAGASQALSAAPPAAASSAPLPPSTPIGAKERLGQAAARGQTPVGATPLARAEETIRYTCPRCKKPLEDPANEAGAKKPCPHCGQRVQVPTPGPASAFELFLPPEQETSLPQAIPLPDAPTRRERCLECGRDVRGWAKVFTCPDCGSVFCCSVCIRNHGYHAHDRRR